MKVKLSGSLLRPTIRKELILGVTSIHAVLMLIFIVGLVARQHSFLLERARERALHQAELLAASAVPQITSNDLAGLSEVVESLSRDPTVRFAMLTDTQGLILGHTDAKHAGEYLRDEISRKQLGQPARSSIVYQGKDMVESVAPVSIENSVLGWAWVAADLRENNAQVAAVTRAGILNACLAITTGMLFALLLAASLTRQLRALLEGADRLAHDNFDQPVPLVSSNEVGVLTRAFNRAMRKLRTDRVAIQQARVELEGEVIERRRAEQELQAANQAIQRANENLREFAHVASHDLQEPLRSVAGFSELLRRKYKGKLDDQADEFIELINSGAIRMQNLIRALLEYSRATASSAAEPVAPVDSAAALRVALDNLNTAIQSTGASIQTLELPTVKAHEIALVQLFQNLISNAIKYSKEHPLIQISAQRDAEFWKFSVADNGIGIDPHDQERIFHIFKRAHGDEYPGSGIGLAICSRIVERYGGRIWVEGAPGQGSTFYFSLPAAPE
ncbi:MAG TPA: ATP-binding protein [Bryobacteraceae bacterium]|nr:ATP-binding protein [Bryobacteraceae bacterium]